MVQQLELMPGEKMVLHSHPHWWYFWKEVSGGVVLIALLLFMWSIDNSGFLGDFVGWLTLAAFLFLLVDTIYRYVQWQTTRFAITDQRVAYQEGMIKRRGVSIPLNRVNNVNFQQSMIARLLNNGIVVIESAGETGDSVFENIPDPEHVRSVIFAQVEADENADSERNAAAMARAMQQHSARMDPPQAERSAQERLQQLEDLRAQGLVSPEEFETKRQKILEDL